MLDRSRWLQPVFLMAWASICLFPAKLPAQVHKQIMGRTEHVLILPEKIGLRAKLDSGAKTSSLHAQRIVYFERAGRRWARFTVTGRKGPPVGFEKEVVRTVKIKRHKGPSMERPVILLGICLGRVFRKVEVNLVDRSKFLYPLLVGRNFIAGRILIDPELRFTAEPACNL